MKEFIDKNKPIKFSGLLTVSDADNLKNGILPTSWCQGSSDKTMIFCEWEDNTFQPLESLYESMCKRFKPYLSIDDINEEDLDEFRIVFWFDN